MKRRFSLTNLTLGLAGIFICLPAGIRAQTTYSDHHYRDLAPDDPEYARDFIRVYHPPAGSGSETRPVAVFFHGGSWVQGNYKQFDQIGQWLASEGFVAASAHYRFMTDAAAADYDNPKELCIADARQAVAWLMQHSAEFGFAPNQVMLGGGSAGGHIATMVALMPDDLTALTGTPVTVRAMLMFNPAYDAGETKKATSLRVDPERQLTLLVAKGAQLPPYLSMFGTDDPWRTQKKFELSDGTFKTGYGRGIPFLEAYRAAGGEAEMWLASGVGHGFFNDDLWGERAIVVLSAFLTDNGLAPNHEPPASYNHPDLKMERYSPRITWRFDHFMTEADTVATDDESDPDGDGWNNLEEFGFGGDPLVADAHVPLALAGDGTMSFRRRLDSGEVPPTPVVLEGTRDLSQAAWQPIALDGATFTPETTGYESVRLAYAVAGGSSFFYRLRVTSATP